MPNVKSIITKHNKTVLYSPTKNKEKCSLQEKWITTNIMYKATLTSNPDTCQHKIYYDITDTKFKQRCANHLKSFRHEKRQSDTELSNKLWSIKNNNYTPNIVWEILRKHQPYIEHQKVTPKGVPYV